MIAGHEAEVPPPVGPSALLVDAPMAPAAITIGVDQRIIPAIRTLDAAGDPLSLSAILLDEVYYQWMVAGRRIIDRLPIVRAEHLIPLKARTWIDLSARRRRGDTVDHRDIRKHRNDVLRLTAIIDPEYTTVVPAPIRTDMVAFIADIQQDPPDLPALGLTGTSLADVVGLLNNQYSV